MPAALIYIAGIACIAIGIILLRKRVTTSGHLLEIRATATSPIAEIVELCKSVSQVVGAGAFNQLVEVKGVVECSHPMKAEISSRDCVYYSMKIEERSEQAEHTNNTTTTKTVNTTVAQNTRSIHFTLTDESGSIAVYPEEAVIQGEDVVDTYHPVSGNTSASISLHIGPLTIPVNENSGVVGHHYSESIIPVGVRVYVIGEAFDRDGELAIRRPVNPEQPFLISVKSEEEVTKGMQAKVRLFLAGGIALIVAGVGLLTAVVMGVIP